ncbi:MAG TPA: hybrid sensor histidine kinase/response regulator, partial [Polyangiaceae bacterium]|nr:hybrid sensor histidine kinase/response regulator [Polyangiaceae bacterium]
AHEINNPLAYVLGNLDFALGKLEAGAPLDGGELAEVAHALGQAREGSARIGHITRDLKVFCRSDAQSAPGPVNVRQVMESSISMAWNQIRHRARLTRQFERVPLVCGDEHRLGQVFLNLLINAAQAFAADQVAHNEIVVAMRVEGGEVLVEVQDNGRGMSLDEQNRAFDPFYTTKAPGIGSGIGLSICRSIVTDMGGEVTCQSETGAGSTFCVRLPAGDVLVHSTRPPRKELPAVLPTTRTLVIDDEPALCAVVRRLLRGQHEVVGLNDARAALELLERDNAFDVIICDIMMPHMSGIEFYHRLRQLEPHLAERVVFMTGGAFDSSAKQFLRTVPNPVLDKPFETHALHETVAQILEGASVSGTWMTASIERAI